MKKNIGRLANVLAFYKLYEDGTAPGAESAHVLDRWILARLNELIRESTDGYEEHQLDRATRPIAGFIDDLSVWYLRRSRERFKEETPDKKAALATLRHVLHTLARVIAPAMPFFAEHLFQAVKDERDEESVHLAEWPQVQEGGFFSRLFGKKGSVLGEMTEARVIVSKALEARDAAKIKVRQPLQKLTVESYQLREEFLALIRDEVNVKQIVSGGKFALDTNITDELREEGIIRDAIRAVQEARKAAKMRPGEHGSVSIQVSQEYRKIVERHLESIQKQTNTEVRLI